MFKIMRLSVLVAIGIIFLLSGMALRAGGKNGTTSKTGLSEQEKIDLRYLRDEEKLARDVYLFFYEAYYKPVFSNIASAEQQHMIAVKTLLDRYGIDDLVKGLGIGEFAFEEHRDLYTALTEFPESQESKELFWDPLQGALYVGATIEDLDIYDIQPMYDRAAAANHLDLMYVYDNLMKGSRNHLRSYGGLLLSLYDYKYQAQYLTQEEVDAIISSAKETGRF